MILDIEQLRTRQAELVRELAVEFSTVRLAELSHELENISRQLESAGTAGTHREPV